MREEHLPAWLRTGGITAVILFGLSALIPRWVEHGIQNAPRGTRTDPLPPDDSAPSDHLFQFPAIREVNTQEVATVLRRRWASQHNQQLTDAQLVPLLAHVALATQRGTRVVSNNLFGLNAGRLYQEGLWTVVREPEWKGGQPVYRWRPIRAYYSLDAGANAWIRMMPSPVQAAIEAGNIDAYADALSATGAVVLPPHLLRPELKAEARRFLRAA